MKKNSLSQMLYKYKLASVFLCVGFLFLIGSNTVLAANCGDTNLDGVTDTACVCGDTVIGSINYTYTLTGNLTCTGHGLLFGSDSITIDGGGSTIDGDNDGTDYGIYNNGYDYATTTNIIITNFTYGIYYNNSANSGVITNNTANSNNIGIEISSSNSNTLMDNAANYNYYGIELSFSDSNILTGNNTNSNVNYGISIFFSLSNILTNNTANSNIYGIYLSFSSSNNLIGNSMFGNMSNLSIENDFSNTINNTNLVNGKPVYYLYNQHGTAETPLVYDGNVLGEIGMFWAIDSSYVEVKNVTLSPNNLYGVYFKDTSNSLIQNITTNSNSQYGIYLESSSANTLTDNITNYNNYYGINLLFSNSNIITSNNANHNGTGVSISSSASNTLTRNNAYFNNKAIYVSNSNSSWSNNSFLHSLTDTMISFTDIDQTIDLNDTVSFNFNMLNINASACNNCTHTITTYPSETINITSEVGNNVQGNFVATKLGIYTLTIKVTDTSGNFEKRNYTFLVGDTDNTSKRFYLRDLAPTHGQPKNPSPHGDAKVMLSTAPVEEEYWQCGLWIQNSPDEIPDYSLANLDSVNIHSWYKQTDADNGYIGIQQFAIYSDSIDQRQSVASASNYTEIDKSFLNLNWEMDYPSSWYWFSTKLKGSNPYWRSTPSQPSYVDFNYSYASAVPIKTISNDEVNVLSAVTDSSDYDNITIQIENPSLTSATTTQIILTSVNRPFLGITTNIDSASTTTFTTNSISANTVISASTINMEVTPENGSVNVVVSEWGDQEDKEWRESGNGTLNTLHVVGDMIANTPYNVKVDNSMASETITGPNCLDGVCTSDSSGNLTFTYTGGYSTHIFSLEKVADEIPEEVVEETNTTYGYRPPQTRRQVPNIAPQIPETNSQINAPRDLELGMIGDDVKALQIILNLLNYQIAPSGPGSPSNETEKFGPLTKQALIKFQKDNNITPAVGYFGPVTRNALIQKIIDLFTKKN